ncbi:MAG: hypothetical protein H6667_04540 [Ardenticatenaceae bacterium]|nr:hypothetical protein [Ardenticatenaceae bacterium]
MSSEQFIYKPQDVNYLGFLEAQLRDLGGIATLTYELIQNGDDALGDKSATTLAFSVTDEALIVENDGIFRLIDFERLQNIASGGKRAESGVTGAFGLGFIAVYQVTDAPEIFSNGRHWIIRPDAPAEQRIQERQVETSGTRFRLPWAFNGRSPVRRALNLEAIHPDQLDDFAAEMAAAIEQAALFLQRLQRLEVWRNGRLLKRIERTTAGSQLILRDEIGQETIWLLLNGEFAAEPLRDRYPWQIEAKRHNRVQMALPTAPLSQPGRLYAVLPTDSTTPLPFPINADFFPTIDRKRIHFGSGYQAEWNQAAIQGAANLLAHDFDELPAQLGPAGLWHLLQKLADTHHLAERGELPAVFTAFWETTAPLLPAKPILFTVQNQWVLPAEGRLLGRVGEDEKTITLLTALGIPIIHPDLIPYQNFMRQPEIATPPLTATDIAAALIQAGLNKPTPLYEAPPFLRRLEDWQTLWVLLDGLLNRLHHPAEKETALAALAPCALALTQTTTLTRLNRTYRSQPEAQLLFPDVDWLHDSITADQFPGHAVSCFGVRQAVERLAEMPPDQLEQEWRLGRLDLAALFRWFESQPIEIFADDPALQRDICRLPLGPVGGELRPLAHLYIPGGFTDPLQLAGLVDVAALSGRPQFLRDLGVRELDFDTYVRTEIPRVMARHPDLPSDARHRLVQLLAQRLGEIRDDEDLQDQLSRLPLVACLDGSFRPANEVYATRDVMALLGERVHIAEPAASQSIRALHRWLGVRDEPAAEDIVQSLAAISRQWPDRPLDRPTQNVVRQSLAYLNTGLAQEKINPQALTPLHDLNVIPNQHHILTRPAHLLQADQPDLAAQFEGIESCLLPPGDDWGAITAVFGIRPLSQVVALQIVTTGEITDPARRKQITSRLPLIQRLLQAEGVAGQAAAFLGHLHVVKTAHLHVQYRLSIGDKTLLTPPETVLVKLDSSANVLYVSDELDNFPWTAVARELALAVKPGQPVGGLAMGIRAVLTAVTPAEAAQILDELGCP